jgi:RHS repeat-associated protein
MIAEKQGTTIRRYFYDGLTPILMEEGGQTYQFQTDHLATPRQMTDTLGNVVWTARLDAYGKVTTETGTVVNNLRFPGQYHDRETGLYYNLHRYYSPELGRYITSDPIGLQGGLNTYAYVGGDPVNTVDPMGLDFWIEGPSGGEPFGHQSFNVGNPHGDYVSYSFGVGIGQNTYGQNCLAGCVYLDTERGGKIEAYIRTTARQDAETRIKLHFSQQEDTSKYYYGADTCRTYSQDKLEEFSEAYGLQTSEPPFRTAPTRTWFRTLTWPTSSSSSLTSSSGTSISR